MNALTRNLKIVFGDVARDVPVRIFWPLEDKGGWGCRWEIDWPDRQRSNFGRGTDAIQALLHALRWWAPRSIAAKSTGLGSSAGATIGPATVFWCRAISAAY